MKLGLKSIQGVVGVAKISTLPNTVFKPTPPNTIFKPTPPNTIFKQTPPSPLFELKRGERAHSRFLPKAGGSTYTPSLLKRGLGGVGQSKFGIIAPGLVQ